MHKMYPGMTRFYYRRHVLILCHERLAPVHWMKCSWPMFGVFLTHHCAGLVPQTSCSPSRSRPCAIRGLRLCVRMPRSFLNHVFFVCYGCFILAHRCLVLVLCVSFSYSMDVLFVPLDALPLSYRCLVLVLRMHIRSSG